MITLFEGFTDSKFFPNSIGMVGVNTDLDFIISSGAEIRFFYDNDKTGLKKSLQMLNEGQKVFLWEKLFKDLIKGKKDPYTLYNKLINIKDLNKLAQIVQDPYRRFKLNNFFSYDKYDKKFLNGKNFRNKY